MGGRAPPRRKPRPASGARWPGAAHGFSCSSSLSARPRRWSRPAATPSSMSAWLHPAAHRLHPVAELVSDPFDRAVLGASSPRAGAHHPHRRGLLLSAVPTRRRLSRRLLLGHDSILVSKVRSLHRTQGGSPRSGGRARRSQRPAPSRRLRKASTTPGWASSCAARSPSTISAAVVSAPRCRPAAALWRPGQSVAGAPRPGSGPARGSRERRGWRGHRRSQGAGVVLAQHRAQRVGLALPRPDHRLVGLGDDLDVLGDRGVPGDRAVMIPIETDKLGEHVGVAWSAPTRSCWAATKPDACA